MNNNKSEIPSVSPEVTFIDDLVANIEGGKIVLPKFQRPYVWKKTDIISLFDSIYKGYPIGSVLLWDGGGKDIPFLNGIGGRIIAKSSGERYYIVDGQQRLTTLFCCLSDDSFDSDGKWDLYFDLKEEKFTHSNKRNSDGQYYISIRSIRKTTSFLKEARRILDESGDDSLVEKAEFLADKIRKYKMAVIKLDGGSLDEVVEVFSRLNSLGKNIGQQDLIYALTYTGDENNRINDFINEVKSCFSKHVDNEENHGEIYLQLIKTAIGFEIYNKDQGRLVERLKYIHENESFELDNIINSLEKTLSYVVGNLGINKISLFPYTNQLFMLFHYFHTGYKNSSIDNLSNWFFFISIFELGRASPSKVEQMIEFFKSGLKKEYLVDELLNSLNENNVPRLSSKYTARSASGKNIAIILNNHVSLRLQGKSIFHSINDYSVFPPDNLFKSFANDVLGGKSFFRRNLQLDCGNDIFSSIEDVIPTQSLVDSDFNNEQIVNKREKIITDIYYDFCENILMELKSEYL